jgi:tetratricopeptide (TPR) repeat protein
MLRDIDCALYAFNKVVSYKSPLSPAAFLYISKSLALKDKYEKAISILTDLKKKRLPDYLKELVDQEIPNQYIVYALKLISDSKFKKALNVLDKLEIISKTDLQKDKAFLLRAIVLMNLNERYEAKKYFITIKEKSLYSDLKMQAESFLKIFEPDKDSFSEVWSNMIFELGENSNIFGTGEEDVKTRGLFSKISFYGAFPLYSYGKFTIGSNFG